MIRGIIVNILSEGIYDVLISEDYENFYLKNVICRLSSDNFKFVTYKIRKGTYR